MVSKPSSNSNSKYLFITTNKTNNVRSNASKIEEYQIDPKVFTMVNDKSGISNKKLYEIENLISNKNLDKHNSASTKEWTNSVYTYNKNYIKNLPIVTNMVNKLFTSYFNITRLIKGKKANSKIIIEKKNSLNKTLVSKAEVKITNDKVNLTVYIYNRNKEILLRKLKESSNELHSSLRLLNNKKGEKAIKKWALFLIKVGESKQKIIEALTEKTDYYKNINTEYSPSYVTDMLNRSFSNYEWKIFLDYLNTYHSKNLLFLYYIREVITNNTKFKTWFLLGLKKTLSNLYNKKIELNIVNQKYFYLNSDIFIKALATRVRNRNNRILREMKKALSGVSLAKFRNNISSVHSKLKKNTTNLKLITNNLKTDIFSSIRYKHVQGIRIEAAGRLTQRLTAARSLSKVKSKGSLKNTQKIYLNKSFSLIRNNLKPNVQYINLNAKTRNGAFGLKGWVNSN